MSGSSECFRCPESGVPPLDRALDELGMLAAVPASRRQHQAETHRRRRRYTISALQRQLAPAASEPADPAPSSSAQIADQMSRIRLDGGGGGEQLLQEERHTFNTLYINWDYVSSVGSGPLRPVVAKAHRARPYESERSRQRSGGRARTSSWSQQQPLALAAGPARPVGPEPATAPGDAAAGALVRSLSMENLKLGEPAESGTDAAAAAAAAGGPDVEVISRRIEDLSVEYH